MTAINTAGSFYPRYKEKNPDFDAATFKCAEETVAELLTHATTSEHPGMLLGKMQSGKTRTFISILALAFDNGYDVAIILTKNSKPLAEQTRKRFEDEFEMFVEDGALEVHDIMAAPDSFSAFELESKLIFIAKKQDDNLRHLINLFSKDCPTLGQLTLYWHCTWLAMELPIYAEELQKICWRIVRSGRARPGIRLNIA